MGVYQEIKQKVLRESRRFGKDDMRTVIDNVIVGQSFFRKTGIVNPLEDMYLYLVILNDEHYGFAYNNGGWPDGFNHLGIVNRDVRDVLSDMQTPLYGALEVALLDALADLTVPGSPLDWSYSSFVASGTYTEKANTRARLVTELLPVGSSCLLIGAVSEIAEHMSQRSVIGRITDLGVGRADLVMSGYDVDIGNDKTLQYFGECEYVIVTGSCLSTQTLDGLMDLSSRNGNKLIFYMETGAALAPLLIRNGVMRVVAERFPFYDMPGDTTMKVYDADVSSALT